jgi:phytoene dehydrogenase-like protein
MRNRDSVLPFYDLLTAPASQFLNKWFESDILIATLATDAIIGSMTSPMI